MHWGLLPRSGKLRCPKCNTMVTLLYEDTERLSKQLCDECGWIKITNRKREDVTNEY